VSVFDQTPACGHKNNWKSVNPSQNTWSTQKKKWTVGTGSVQTTGRKQRCVRKKYVDTYTITYKMQVKLYFL